MSHVKKNSRAAICAAMLAVVASQRATQGDLAAAALQTPQGFDWALVALASSNVPSPRSGHRIVYDSARERVVLFGGRDVADRLMHDVWEFDTLAQSWSAVTPASAELPPPRADFGMAYDAGRGRVVVYGGVVDGGLSGETWEWDGAMRLWSLRAADSLIPGAMWGGELAYDPNLQRVILFGGAQAVGTPENATTYAWDGASWTAVSSAGPAGRVHHAMSADPARSTVTLFGGRSAGTALADTWEWNGATWIKLDSGTPGATPSVTTRAALAFDRERRVQVLFGGEGSGETWEWDGGAWIPRATDDAPSARATAMAYDESQLQIVLFGGHDGSSAVGDTWLGSPTVPVATETTIVAASPVSSTYGESVTLTAVVTTAAGLPPTGSVEFFDNGTSLGVELLIDGSASLSTSRINAGDRSLTAEYRPAGPFAASTSPVFSYSVRKRSTTSSLTLTPAVRQYSDRVTFEASITTVNDELPAESVTFKVGTQVMGTAPLVVVNGMARATLSDVALLEPSPRGTAPTGQMKPAPLGRTATAQFNDVNPNFTVYNAIRNLMITKEDARATYTGALQVSTANGSTATATVPLSATIRDISATPDAGTDTDAGDIRNATVTFINRDTGAPISPAIAVSLTEPGDTTTGTVAYDWQVNLGTANAQTFRVGILVDNYYLRNSSADDSLVTVAKGIATGFATGGGNLRMSTSGGLKPADAGSLNNFGFGARYTGNGSKPAGHFNTMIRSAGAVYHVKGLTYTSLVVSGKTATLKGTATVYNVTSGSTVSDSAATFEVTIADMGDPGTADRIGITIRNAAGVVWFSSNWNGISTGEQVLDAGNIRLP